MVSLFVVRRSKDSKIEFLQFFAYSTFNAVIWLAPYILAQQNGFADQHPFKFAAGVITALFLLPCFLGLAHAYFLRKFGGHFIATIPTAWDWYFSRSSPVMVVVTLKDGSKVYGRFGSNSFASSQSEERDIYIENVYDPDTDSISGTDGMKPVEKNGGILIKSEQIQFVEFYR